MSAGMPAWTNHIGYPDPRVEVLDERFLKYRLFHAPIERLYTGTRWAEGPVWIGDGGYLLWSDIPNDRVMRWTQSNGVVDVFRQPSNFANGHTRDRQGRLLTCEQGTRSVTRTEYDGRITVITDRFDGKRLNSPNDIVVRSDDSIWFTDPPFGILSDYDGFVAEAELPTNIYRVDGRTGRITMVCGDIARPNGLCFSPDESLLYVVESGREPRRIWVFDVSDDGERLLHGRTWLEMQKGETPDGFRCDVDGNIWAGWGMSPELDGVRIFAPDASPIGHIHLPERCANLCFGGPRMNRLFMASCQSLYSVYTNARGF